MVSWTAVGSADARASATPFLLAARICWQSASHRTFENTRHYVSKRNNIIVFTQLICYIIEIMFNY
jgi:hypothetical protein